MIFHGLNGKSLPIYGDGANIRDWLYVKDHCAAIRRVLEVGQVGETYNIGGNCEKTNLEVVNTLCGLLDEMIPESTYAPHENLIAFVKDRPGHDRRYAINASKIQHELGWQPTETFETGLRKTVEWYLDHQKWAGWAQDYDYRGERLGLGGDATISHRDRAQEQGLISG